MNPSNAKPKYPGIRVTTNGNTLVSAYTEALICDAGIFFPITPSTEMGEHFQQAFANGQLNAFGKSTVAIQTEGEHSAQSGAIAFSITGKRVVNFTSAQGLIYGLESYYHAPAKLSTMVMEIAARSITKSALNIHCSHDDVYAAADTGWNICFGKNAQQVADQALILRKVNELSLNPGINVQDGFLTTHVERTYYRVEPELIREFLGDADDIIDCPTEAQKVLFGPKRKRVPATIDLKYPVVCGTVQNQEHFMNGVAARRNNFSEYILKFFESAYEEFARLTGRKYGLISEYKCDDAEVVFVSMGSSAENIEVAVDYLRETRNAKVGVIHINVFRPFPENAIINALRGKKKVIILERTDEPLACDNPLTRDIKVALSKGIDNYYKNIYEHLDKISPEEKPEILSGVYGLGARDFRQEDIIGAYDFALGKIARKDGKKYGEGTNFFYLSINHPYAVVSDETPSGLPKGAIAVRFHSIGGWGMITTGKNLAEILGEFSDYTAKRNNIFDEYGNLKEVINVIANPKYGAEKKGGATAYFLVAAPEPIRVNCDLKHIDVVLCCDPKIFLHYNPLEGLKEGGVFVWESSEPTAESAWQRIPKKYRKEIIDKKIQVYILNGFEIARKSTDKFELQTRMQGNAFLGAFFKVSTFLKDYNIPEDEYRNIVRHQYVKRFGRFGEAVVESNMKVMEEGYNSVKKVEYGDIDTPDTSAYIGQLVEPCVEIPKIKDHDRPAMYKISTFDAEFRAGFGYYQPSTPYTSTGIMAPATGATITKFISRLEVPVWNPHNCTQCLDCITVCPDSALPSTAQDISTILSTAFKYYASDEEQRIILFEKLSDIEKGCRQRMIELCEKKDVNLSFGEIVIEEIKKTGVNDKTIEQLNAIFSILPLAYKNVRGIFLNKEKKEPGSGGVFGIFVNDLCKGCASCVEACGNRHALTMVQENEDNRANHLSALKFFKLLPDTPQKYLGNYDALNPQESKAATLRNHLMQYSKYNAFVAGDGACAGCGEKTVLRVVSTLTEALMRPVFHAKADRLLEKGRELEKSGLQALTELKQKDEKAYNYFRKTILQTLMGFGGVDEKDTDERVAKGWKGTDKDIIDALIAVMRQDAYNHKEHQAIEGFLPNGMSAMAMTACTGCNTVYGSTPPSNPHTYPWMNSLFQDAVSIGWLIGESFMQNHCRRSVVPERLADILLNSLPYSADDYFLYTHFSDTYTTDREILEMPKVWGVGGDGGLGDIGFQNVSKAVLQNRPSLKILLLDTQVYSNTGGQNSDSSVMLGGFDMNQFGSATEGKLTEKKSVAEALIGGHGSPFVAQISIANVANLYKAIMDALNYRGTAFIQAYTPCQPEHGIGDFMSEMEARNVRDSRSFPEFIFNSRLGESYQETLDIKGNPDINRDWYQKPIPGRKEKYDYTPAHFAFNEARFRLHFKEVKEEDVKGLVNLKDKLQLITIEDFIHRRLLDKNHRSFIPKWGVYTIDYKDDGTPIYYILSRQMVLFCFERRKAWRMLQSRAGVENIDYKAQKEVLKEIDSGKISVVASWQ